uniref:Large ribosomal subunit protein uL22c n=1 Tax=Actinostachys pennula TaxID=148577 RepID=A0A1U7AFJ6_9MONI|nr:ribosomal protein L22 [Actinostachys pennula]
MRSYIAKTNDEWKTQTKASLNNVRTSASKTRRVVNQIRGCSYEQALVLLEFLPYKACYFILQLILSAAENVRNNCDSRINKSDLFISEAHVDNVACLKRFRFRAQGRGYPIHKPFCRITVTLMLRNRTKKA